MSDDHPSPFSTLVELAMYRAEVQPEDTVYRYLVSGEVDGEVRSLTFAELARRARAIAAFLQKNGYAGQRAILLYPPGLEFIEGFFGCLFAGVIAVPAFPPDVQQPERTLSRLRAIITNARAELLLSNRFLADAAGKLLGRMPDLAGLAWVITDDIPDDEHREWRLPAVGPSSTAFLQYTSGSTRNARGVIVSHANLLHNQLALAAGCGHVPERIAAWQGDLFVSWLPMFHDMGLIAPVLQALFLGKSVTFLSPLHFLQKPLRWLQAISHYRPFTSGGPNFAFDFCVAKVKDDALASLDLSSWEVAFSGAEPVRWETIERFSKKFARCGFRAESVLPAYGLAEATLAVALGPERKRPTVLHADAEALNRGELLSKAQGELGSRALVGCGKTWGDILVKIVHPEQRTECKDGEVGEIWIHGPSVAGGYWDDPEATAATFEGTLADGSAERFLRSGDLGLLQDGELFVTGRIKDLLIVDGKNHYPQDLEWTAEECHPSVRRGCVAAFSIEAAEGERPVIVAELNPAETDVDGVFEALRGAIARAHGLSLHAALLIPPQVIPKTSSGKIRRSACREAFLGGKLTTVARRDFSNSPRTSPNPPTMVSQPAPPVPPPTPALDGVAAWLTQAIAKRAGVDPFEVVSERPLADFGLGSRVLVELTGELGEFLGRELPTTLFYEQPTVARVVEYLGGRPLHSGRRHTSRASLLNADEAIAVVSMACRFPGGVEEPEQLWDILLEGKDVVQDFPAERWDVDGLFDPDPEVVGKSYTRQGGFIGSIDGFDAGFFGISPREAQSMDPQQRLLLETAWEALERAGVVPGTLNESVTGVYIGMYESGYSGGTSLEQLDGYVGTGSFASVASGRLAYALGLQGPALTVDTACSSSLVSLHLASQALRSGECDLALAGGITLMVTPRAFVEFSRLRGLSPSGRCKSFSADADGAGWAEGCGLLVLKRLSDAQRDGDRILGLLRGTAVNQDGRSQGLTAPNGPSQERVILRALEQSGLMPGDIDYVEAHGTGTTLGDPIEANALARVFAAGRSAEQPLWLGSLKSNIAHTQAAAGIAGVIKVLLALQHEQLPKTLHARKPSMQVDWERSRLALLSEARPWPRKERVRRAGVSAFGISGTNAHVILEEAPLVAATATTTASAFSTEPARTLVFVLSARSEAALRAQAARLRSELEARPELSLTDVAYTLATRRTHFDRRAAVVANGREQLLVRLAALENGETGPGIVPPASLRLRSGKLVFVFPGQGSQWAEMAKTLLDRCAVFSAELGRCDAALALHTGWSVLSVLRGEPGAPELERVEVIQPALFAMMVSLAAHFRALGVEPDAVIGHSQGEVAAAYVCGALSLEEAAKVVALRARALSTIAGRGAMAAIDLPLSEVERRLLPWREQLSVAGINSARSTTVSGEPAAIDALLESLTREQIFARKIRVDVASHSPQIDTLREALSAQLGSVTPSVNALPFYSTVSGQPLAGEPLDAGYWYRNLREPVRFASAAERLLADGFRFFVEVSPHPLLVLPLVTVAEAAGVPAQVVASLRREQDSEASLAQSLAELHVAGRELDWSKLIPGGVPVNLPTYPFERQRYWLESRQSLGASGLKATESPLLGSWLESAGSNRHVFVSTWSRRSAKWLSDHVVFGEVVLSATTILELCRAALLTANPDKALEVSELELVTPLILPERGNLQVQLEITEAAGEAFQVELYARLEAEEQLGWTLHATGLGAPPAVMEDEPFATWPASASSDWANHYELLNQAGLAYGPSFRCVSAAARSGTDLAWARVALPTQLHSEASRYGVHPALLDAALHASTILFGADQVMLPASIERWSLAAGGPRALNVKIERESSGADGARLSLSLWDDEQAFVGRLSGVSLRRTSRAKLQRAAESGRDLYEVMWQQLAPTAPDALSGTWTVLAESDDDAADALCAVLRDAGAKVERFLPGAALPPGVECVVRSWPRAEPAELASAAHALAADAVAELKATLAAEPPPRTTIWLTRGAVASSREEGAPSLWQAPLWGLARSARTEHPELGLRLIDLGTTLPPSAALLSALITAGEPELAIREARLRAPRLVHAEAEERLEAPLAECIRLEALELGRLDRLEFRATPRAELLPHQVRIAVRAAGLNFRDVAHALNLRPNALSAQGSWDTALGSECAGIVSELGFEVTGLSVGQRVLAIAVGSFGSEALADARLVVPIPEQLSFTEAASVPIAFATAYYALCDLAQVRAGERVLIHAAAGGVGMAALQLARLWGLEVYATASESKWRVLAELGVPSGHVASSRTLDFVGQFRRSCRAGVDVVLNSLAGEYVDASLSLLAARGRFLELGKTDVRALDAVTLPAGARYRAFDLAEAGPERLGEILRGVVDRITHGELQPLRHRCFQLEQARAAFRLMSQGKHVGKIVLEVASARSPVPREGTVLISGALGALGARVALWLAERGVQRLLLTSRRGSDDPRAPELLAALSARGVEVELVACDIGERTALGRVLESIPERAPLRGVVHCAGLLDDGVLLEQSAERLERVMRPKLWGAWHLHELTQKLPLELFVLFSSAAGVVGAAGQSNYAAANVFLDQLAHERRARGLVATSLSWGAWAGAGLAVEHANLDRMAEQGFAAFAPERGLGLLELALRGGPHLVPWALKLSRLQKSLGKEPELPALWRRLVLPQRAARAQQGSLVQSLARLSKEARRERVLTMVREDVAQVLGLGASDVTADQPLRNLGLDSLRAVELRNKLVARFDRRLPATLLFDYPTPDALTQHLLGSVLELDRVVVAASRAASAAKADEAIAVVSMACRFPGGVEEPEQLWDILWEGKDVVQDFPAERWDVEGLFDPDPEAVGKSYARQGGFIGSIDGFDAGFFGISPREAQSMDPQQRLLLETAWEALERAGVVPGTLNESVTGVYIGMYESGYSGGTSLEQLDGYVGTGSFASVASGRLAYALGLQGPALTVDTACSSSLVSLHLASQALRSGECDLALAGGITLMVTPRAFVEFSRLRGLSPSGRCKSFSADADGAGWAEGCGLLILKRLSDAQRDGDRILGLLRGTAVNQDGRSQGLTAPNGPSQERVILRALEQSGLMPGDIDYVEAHGTGTTLGDPIEANALARVFAAGRSAEQPLWLGSLKSNIAHAQAAAGVAGVIKVLLALQHEQLPKTLHASQPTPHVDWERSGLALLSEARPWPRKERVRRAGVSAFGISGTNAHVILEEAPRAARAVAVAATAMENAPAPALVFALSARSELSLRAQASRLRSELEARPELSLTDVAYTLAAHRTHFDRRAAVVAKSREELLIRLAALENGESGPGIVSPRAQGSSSGKLVFVFPGHGQQWADMALVLLERAPVFAAELARCDAALAPHTSWSLLSVLRGEPAAPELERVDVLQPALFAMMASLAAHFRALGVEPDAVVGHSVGEVAAAYVSGALSLEAAAKVVALRSRALARFAGLGAMAAVELPLAELEARLLPWKHQLSIAGTNSARSTTVSGEPEAIDALLAELAREQIFARKIRIRFASHSPQMEPLAPELLERLADIRGHASQVPLYSTVLGEQLGGEQLDARYWYRNLREPVRFASAVTRLIADGARFFVEVSAHPVLTLPLESLAEEAKLPLVVAGSLRREQDSEACIAQALAELYVAGRALDWSRLIPSGELVQLPTYPFERQRYWLSAASSTRAGAREWPLLHVHVESSDQPGRHLFEAELNLADEAFAYLKDHRVGGVVWLPGAAVLEMALQAARRLYPEYAISLERVTFAQAIELRDGEALRLQLILQPRAGDTQAFSIASRPAQASHTPWLSNASGGLRVSALSAVPSPLAIEELRERCSEKVSADALYARFADAGFDYGAAFRQIQEGWAGKLEALAKLTRSPRSAYVVHPATLDAALQAVALPSAGPSGRMFVPVSVEQLQLVRAGQPAWSTCSVRSMTPHSALVDFEILDEQGAVLIEVRGFRLVAAAQLDSLLFDIRWKPRPLGTPSAIRGKWLILSDDSGVGAALASKLGANAAIIVEHSAAFSSAGPQRFSVDPENKAHFQRLLQQACGSEPPERIVHLWSLDAPSIDSPETLSAAQRLACSSTLHLTQASAEMGWKSQPRLFLVTRGAQPARASEDVSHPEQALLWGFGATLSQEHPELTATLIDLESGAGVEALWSELSHADPQTRVALRGTTRLVPRLVRSASTWEPRANLIARDKTYLVTGGLGGLGSVVAERLIQLGARHVALVGRRAPLPELEAKLAELRAQGSAIHVLSADVADRASLQRGLAQLQRIAPPIAGVVHAAGVLDDATLLNLTADRIEQVLLPKVLATSLLSDLLPELDFFVTFSSIAGVFGSPGQASYAAANAYLDAWAHHRARSSLPALSLDWGAWSNVGLASASRLRSENVTRRGFELLSPEQGADLFERMLSSGRRQLAPVALDLGQLRAAAALTASLPLLEDLVGEPTHGATHARIVERVRSAASAEEQLAILDQYLHSAVGRVLGGALEASSSRPLKELGADSLMLLTLRNLLAQELSLELPTSTFLSLSTIEALALHLRERLVQQTSEVAVAMHAFASPTGNAEHIERRQATRDVMRLLRSEQQGTPSAAHHIGLSLKLRRRTTPQELEGMLHRLSRRHAALRMAIVEDSESGHSIEVHPEIGAALLRCSRLDSDEQLEAESERRLSQLLETPFELARAPLWRFELLETPSGTQLLSFGAHHAVSDAQSLILVSAELDAELGGRALGSELSNQDLESLLRSQPPEGALSPDGPVLNWRREFAGCKRLELTLARPRPSQSSFEIGTRFVAVDPSLLERVSAAANGMGTTAAAFFLGALAALLARVTGQSRFAVAVPVDTRPHADAPDAIGFFGVPVPLPMDAHPDEPLTRVIQRTDQRLTQVLQPGAAFANALPALVAEGLHREGAPLIEVYFNYIRPRAARFSEVELMEVGSGSSDLDLMLTVAPDLRHLRIDFNRDILDEGICVEFSAAYLALLAELTADLAANQTSLAVADVRLSEVLQRAAAAAKPKVLALAATFALGQLTELLGLASEEAGHAVLVEEAPYHQVIGSLRDPQGVFARENALGGIALLRAADLVRYQAWSDQRAADLADELVAAFAKLRERTRVPLLVGILPTQAADPKFEAWDLAIGSRLAELGGVTVLRGDDWTRYYPVDARFSPEAEAAAHLPFTPSFLAAVALTLTRTLSALRRPPLKVVAVDGDDTLWGGIAGELGPDAVELGGGRATLARKLLELREAGVLLALISNNDEATVRQVLGRRDSLLKPEHFARISAEWGPKTARLEQCARSLGFSLESFVFLDDNPVQIAAVRAELPEVMAVTVPESAELPAFLDHLWALDVRATTKEDRARAAFYRTEAARSLLREQTDDFASFIEGLKLELEIQPLDSSSVERSTQLSRRTTQFNLRAGALDDITLQKLQSNPGHEIWTVSVRDRFGDYGQVGVLVLRRETNTLEVLHWMLSCRVLGRGVEERILKWLADRSENLGCSAVSLIAEYTPRNVPARRLLAALGGGAVENQRLAIAASPLELRAFRLSEPGQQS